jgi:hypothetical protein
MVTDDLSLTQVAGLLEMSLVADADADVKIISYHSQNRDDQLLHPMILQPVTGLHRPITAFTRDEC